MGNLIVKKNQYKQLEFIPNDLQYKEFDDIAGLQNQINSLKDMIKNMKIHDKNNLNTLRIELVNIKKNLNNNWEQLTFLKGKLETNNKDLESLLDNDKVLNARLNILEEKVKFDEFVNSSIENSEYQDTY